MSLFGMTALLCAVSAVQALRNGHGDFYGAIRVSSRYFIVQLSNLFASTMSSANVRRFANSRTVKDRLLARYAALRAMDNRFEDRFEEAPTPWTVADCNIVGNQESHNTIRRDAGRDLKCCHNGDNSALKPWCELPAIPAIAEAPAAEVPAAEPPAAEVPAAKAPAAKAPGGKVPKFKGPRMKGFNVNIDDRDKHVWRMRCATERLRLLPHNVDFCARHIGPGQR